MWLLCVIIHLQFTSNVIKFKAYDDISGKVIKLIAKNVIVASSGNSEPPVGNSNK